jgi:hypothetical protein
MDGRSHSARAPVVDLLDLEEYTCCMHLDAPAHGRSAGRFHTAKIYRKFVVETIAQAGGMHAIVAHS